MSGRIAIALLFSLAGAGMLPGFAQSERILHVRYEDPHWQIWTMHARGDNAAALTQSAWDKRCLLAIPGTQDVLCRDNQGKLYRWQGATRQLTPVQLDGLETIKDYDLNPHRGYLIASYAPNATDNIRIWWFAPDGHHRRLVVADPYLNEIPRWLPSQESFLFVKSHQGRSRICRGTLAASPVVDILTDPFANHTEPAVSPEGKQVAYCRETETGMDLWMAQIDGAQPRSLYAGVGMETDPCWSRRGDRIYFATWDGEHFRIARVDVQGRGFAYVSPAGVDCRYPACVSSEP